MNHRWGVVCENYVTIVTPNSEAEATRLAEIANGPGRKCKAHHEPELTGLKAGSRRRGPMSD